MGFYAKFYYLNYSGRQLSQPTVTDSQPTVTDSQPTVTDSQPTVMDSQPTDSYHNLPIPIATYRHLLQPTDTYFNLLLKIITILVNEFGHS